MQLLFPLYYRQFGIRRLQTLSAPKTFVLNSLPKESMVHHLTHDDVLDIDTSRLYFAQYKKLIYVDYCSSLTSFKGVPKEKSVMFRDKFREFHRTNKNFKFLLDHYKVIKDQTTLLITNYNYLNLKYNYFEVPLTSYYKWWNLESTRINSINACIEETHRNNFIFIKVPKEIPSYSLFNMFLDDPSPIILKVFDTPEKLFLLELYKWLDPSKRFKTIFADLKLQNIQSLNLVLETDNGSSVLLNLGYLNSWIKTQQNTTEFSTVTQVKHIQLQKFLLILILYLQTNFVNTEITSDTTNTDLVVDDSTKDELDLHEQQELKEDKDEYQRDHQVDEEEDNAWSDGDNGFSYINKTKTKPLVKSNIEIQPVNLKDDAGDLTSKLNKINKELSSLEIMSLNSLKQKGLSIDKNGNIVEHQILEKTKSIEELQKIVYEDKPVVDIVTEKINEAADYGLLSAPDYRKFLNDVKDFQALPDPYGSKDKLITKTQVSAKDVQIDTSKTNIVASDLVINKDMLNSSLLSFDEDYLRNVLQKDILSMTSHIQSAGVLIKNYEIEKNSSALGDYEHHIIDFKPIGGASSKIHFRIPSVKDDGSFVANGNKYILRKQRVDLPIRKIKPYVVQLSTYYGKTFVSLSDKKANNSIEWLIKKLNQKVTEGDTYIKKLAPADVFNNNFEAPFIYNAMAHRFKTIIAGNNTLLFDSNERYKLMSDDAGNGLTAKDKIEQFEKQYKGLIVGYNNNKDLIFVDNNNEFFYMEKNARINLGNIFDVLAVDESSAPIDYSEVRIFSKTIPVGLALSYFIGFNNLLQLLNVKYEISESRSLHLQKNQYAIRFSNKSYIFDKKDRVNSFILGGFLQFEKAIRQFDAEHFNKKDVYLNILASKGFTSIYIRELELTNDLFVDPISKSILESMNEPITFRGLLIRSTEMLQTYHHPDTQDTSVMRIRSYERFSGVIYKELTSAIRSFKNRNIAGKSKIDISPYQVWSTIMKDPTIKLVEDINPIQNLKESEIVTFVGEGGRTKDSLSKDSRAYHRNDMGVVSEATVDSADVGINAYLSADPMFKNIRGVIKGKEGINSVNLLSTSALLAPGSSKDDPRRVNFVSIQQSHTIAAEGYHQPYIRTGYEYVLPNRTSDMFAYTAKQDGVITSKSDKGIVVQYSDGSVRGVSLGRVYGKAEGSVYPHDIISNLKEGDKVVKGDTIAYNTGFFEQDFLDKKRIILKNSMTVKTALLESNQTFEDSSSISRKLSNKLKSKSTKIKSITVGFNQNLRNVVKEGQKVSPKDILLVIEDEITSNLDFDSESILALQKFSNQAPRAKYEGTIDRIEVFYHGSKQDMSTTLKTLADKSDKTLADIYKSSGRPVITGEVNEEYRVSGVPLTLDKAEIKIYITIETPAGVGDKGVFANQMKSVFGEVMDKPVVTESGEEIDAIFGFRSIIARVVTSPVVIGTTTTLLKVIAKKAVSIYKS